MKTVKQISSKIRALQNKLSKKKVVYENFGDREQRLLDSFIGDVYDYPYEMRLEIQNMTNSFFNWCINYTGN